MYNRSHIISSVESPDPSQREVIIRCTFCRNNFSLLVPTFGMIDWVNGMLIQNALPTLNKEERELLISGTCSSCFDTLFRDDTNME